jgi:PAS domain S-box-containing protein
MSERSHQYLIKIKELQQKLEEAEQLIEAIKSGEVDAFAIRSNEESEIYTLHSGDYAYRVLVEELSEGAANITEEGMIVYINPYLCEFFKLSYEKIISSSIYDFIHENSRADFKKLFEEAVKGKSKGEIELLVNGRKYPVYVSLTSLQPKLATVGMLVTDLGERKQFERTVADKNSELVSANQELINQKDFVENIINSSKEWIGVWDKNFRLSMINDASAKAMGNSKEELIGKHIFELNPGAKGSKPDLDLQRALKGETINNSPYFSEWTKKWIQNYLVPLRDNTGEIYAALAIAQDVTEMLNAQVELKKSQKHFSTLFNMSPVAKSISHISDGTVIDVNPAWEKLFERKREDVIGKNAIQIGLTNARERAKGINLISENGGEHFGFELKFDLGNNKYIFTHAAAVTIELDGVPCYLSAYFDITDRKIAEGKIIESAKQLAQKNMELESLNRDLESFNYVASHDLQEPLRKIITFINLIEKNNFNEESIKKYFPRMSIAASNMSDLIKSVLEFSRVSKSEFSFEETDLDKTLKDVLTSYELSIKEKNASVTVSKLPVIHANAVQMNRLFSNLLSNSLKFSEHHPKIDISAIIVDGNSINHGNTIDKKKKYLQLTFADNGIGFDSQFTEQIFKPFQRLHSNDQYRGTGIGLSIVKKIVEQHNGHISVKSIEKEGTEFNIWLPVF